jgi:3'-phosphoadenosine 5'-phosphosulfate sulfotransferase (PAPS reductase)/FAD synthetase
MVRSVEMKHIILYSGGISSAYVAWMVAQKEDKKDITLLHTPTYSENHDADIFRHQVARYIGLPITEWGDGRNIWEIIEDNHCIPGQFIPFCTQQLKQKMKEQYYKTLDDDFIEYVGFGSEEYRRVQRAYARNEAIGRKTSFPIFDAKIPSDEIKRIITEEWKIKLPKAYDDLNHNNCIPCFKAGKDSWRIYWSKYPEQFNLAVKYEEKIGHTVFKDKSLKELADIWENDKEWNDSQINFNDIIPCDCWN